MKLEIGGRRVSPWELSAEQAMAMPHEWLHWITLNGEPLTDTENAECAAFLTCLRRGWEIWTCDEGWGVAPSVFEKPDTHRFAPTLSAALDAALKAQSEGEKP